jgi:hypothetical protein
VRKEKKVHQKGFLINEDCKKKRPETTTSCGLKSHPRRDSHRKRPETTSCGLKIPSTKGIPTETGLRQQQVVAQNPIHEGIPTERGLRQQQVMA